jgi:6-phosphogluconolactonase
VDVKLFSDEVWAIKSAILIHEKVSKVLRKRGACNVMLTGGRSAAKLYVAWASLLGLNEFEGVSFYFGDERCVPRNSPESNYALVMRTLFHSGVPKGCKIIEINGEAINHDLEASSYEKKLPNMLDILLLGLGDDGHIASLFPFSDVLNEGVRKMVAVTSPLPPHYRITLTPLVIQGAVEIFVLALGRRKAEVMLESRNSPANFMKVPACLVLDATWLMSS